MLVLDTGEIQKAAHYGAATVTGADVDAGFSYLVSGRYQVNAGVLYTYIAYDFEGNGALTDRNNDGEVDVGGALDQYVGGYLTMGTRF